MRTTIEIDDRLLAEAMRRGGLKTEREAVQEALKRYVRIKSQADIRELRGKIEWVGDLEASRRSRTFR